MIDATAIVLAGGKSQRLGINKPFLRLGKLYLIEIVVNKLKEIFDKIIIVANKKNYPPMTPLWIDTNCGVNHTIVRDKIENKGPLGGLYTGLLSIESPYAFVVACDMPYLNKALIEYMTRKIKDCDAVVPQTAPAHFEMLHSFYTQKCITVIDRLLGRNELHLRSLLPFLRVHYVLPKEIKRFDRQGRSFTNINTKDDLAKLKNDILY